MTHTIHLACPFCRASNAKCYTTPLLFVIFFFFPDRARHPRSCERSTHKRIRDAYWASSSWSRVARQRVGHWRRASRIHRYKRSTVTRAGRSLVSSSSSKCNGTVSGYNSGLTPLPVLWACPCDND